ncbi:MAG: peptide chain release factor N(5)-glutamine methyltransferase [Polyangiaceae bacterium]|nr:peptide chain release factor N(5)-glutamine methyltransferase [Polyangiaceae bacterium]
MNRTPDGSEPTDAPWTVARVLAWATEDFRNRGTDSPRLEAELLLAHVLGWDRLRLVLERQRPLATEELGRFRAVIRRRRTGEPTAYILGQREFYGLSFRVDARVLVPRPDTEALVDVALRQTRPRFMSGAALDLCTGSGCVAVAFARLRPTWEVTGTEIEPGAAALARENALRLGAWNALRVVEGDLFAPLEPNERFDLIVGNPPYIPDGEISRLPSDVRDHEPRRALAGGADGLELIRRIVAQAPSFLNPGGVLALEIGCDQGAATRALFRAHGFVAVEVDRDLGQRERVVSGVIDAMMP